MLYIEQSLPTTAANLALDEALLEQVELAGDSAESLRVWQTQTPFIVLGRSSKVKQEVEQELADAANIPIFRRVSGGATIVAASGCMFYAVVLSLDSKPHLRMLDEAHRYVVSRLQSALLPLVPNLRLNGTCDLVLAERKVSGNSMRLLRRSLLYHGTLLLNMDLQLVDQLLKHPPREPDYRQGRRHLDFLANLHLPFEAVADSLRLSWKAQAFSATLPVSRVEQLIAEKYSQATWNLAR